MSWWDWRATRTGPGPRTPSWTAGRRREVSRPALHARRPGGAVRSNAGSAGPGRRGGEGEGRGRAADGGGRAAGSGVGCRAKRGSWRQRACWVAHSCACHSSPLLSREGPRRGTRALGRGPRCRWYPSLRGIPVLRYFGCTSWHPPEWARGVRSLATEANCFFPKELELAFQMGAACVSFLGQGHKEVEFGIPDCFSFFNPLTASPPAPPAEGYLKRSVEWGC